MFAGETEYIRLLAVLASPLEAAGSLGALDVAKEWQNLTLAIVHAEDQVYGVRAPWALEQLTPQSEDVLQRKLKLAAYHIVHFGCHCHNNELHLEDETGGLLRVSKDQLAAELKGVGLVVLNACDSVDIARFLTEETGAVNCAIGTTQPIRDYDARVFASRFYKDLGLGKCIEEALQAAQSASTLLSCLKRFGDPSWTPQVHKTPRAREHLILPYPPRSSQFPEDALEGFVGRRLELQQIGEWLKGSKKVLTLYGPGGSGKTTLAANAAARFSHRFVGVAYVSAKDRLIEAGDVIDALRSVQGNEYEDASNEIKRRLSDGRRPVLLVLDNVETIQEPSRSVIAKTLQEFDGISGSRVILTSRPQAHEMIPGQASRHVESLSRSYSIRLILRAWESFRSKGQPPLAGTVPQSLRDKKRLETIAQSAALPNHPLLSEIAALDHLATLAHDHPYLLRLAGELAGRYSYADAVMRFSHKRGKDIEEAMQNLFGTMFDWLSKQAKDAAIVLYSTYPFVAGADDKYLLAITRLVTNNPQLDHLIFQDNYLTPAVKSGLLTQRGTFYELDPPVRSYLEYRQARVKQEAPSRSALQLYHARVVLDGLRDSFGRLQDIGWENVSVALDRLRRYVLEQDPAVTPQEAATLLVEYARMWREVLTYGESVRRLDWIAAARKAASLTGDQETEAMMLEALGDVYQARREPEEALQHYRAALDLFRGIGSYVGETYILYHLHQLAQASEGSDNNLMRHGYSLGRDDLQGSEREHNVVLALGDLYSRKINIAQSQGREREAAEFAAHACSFYVEALELYRRKCSIDGQIDVLLKLGDLMSYDVSTADKALQYYEQARGFAVQTENKRIEARTWESLGASYRILSRLNDARDCYEKALDGYRIIRDKLLQANVLMSLASMAQGVAEDENHLRYALTHYQEAQKIYQEYKNLIAESRAWAGMELVWLNLGNEIRSQECYDESARLAELAAIR